MLRLAIGAACLLINHVTTELSHRLDSQIKPDAYLIVITPYFDTGDDRAFTFDGEVAVTFTSDEPITQIKIHSYELNFTAVDIIVTNNITSAPIALNSTNPLYFEPDYEFAFINMETELEVNVGYILKIVYRGQIRDDLTGFYNNFYIEKGVKKRLGATQMSPTFARKVFPCFDEPKLRAVFTLTIDRPASYKPTLSNTKMRTSISLSNGYVREVFYPTPRMSTYLVGFLISEFEVSHYIKNGSREFGVFTRPDATNQSDFAYGFGLEAVNALGNYFGIDYYSASDQLKLNHASIPRFKFSAMENWGLVLYKEEVYLYVPEESSPEVKLQAAYVIAHETTHSWFGNLVTCHWWGDVWLKEGFATYFQFYITAQIEPELGSANTIVTDMVYSALNADEDPSASPISNNIISNSTEVLAHFNAISYRKAGSVIRMMHHLIGDEAFQYGLNAYLTSNKFQAGYPNLVYAALDKGVKLKNTLASYPNTTIADVMSSWISQAGHPVVTVQVNYDDGSVTLTQERFYINSSDFSNETYKIPITFTTANDPDFESTQPAFIMDDKTYTFRVDSLTKSNNWIILNIQETGLFRVNYDSQTLKRIIQSLNSDKERTSIHHLNRAKIVNDLFALYFADYIAYHTLDEALEFLRSETNSYVWYAAIENMNKLRDRNNDTHVLFDIDTRILDLMQNQIASLGYEEREADDYQTILRRMWILKLACTIGHADCVKHSVTNFRRLVENGQETSPSLRFVSYCIGVKYGSASDVKFLRHRMETANVASEARTINNVLETCMKSDTSAVD